RQNEDRVIFHAIDQDPEALVDQRCETLLAFTRGTRCELLVRRHLPGTASQPRVRMSSSVPAIRIDSHSRAASPARRVIGALQRRCIKYTAMMTTSIAASNRLTTVLNPRRSSVARPMLTTVMTTRTRVTTT